MNRFAVAAALCLALFAGMAQAQISDQGGSTDPVAVSDSGYYLTLFGQPGEHRYESLKAMVRSPYIKGVAGDYDMHFAEVDTDTAMYTERYAASTPVLPCVRLQDANGKVIYQATGKNVPGDHEGIAEAMRACPRRRSQPSVKPLEETAPPSADPLGQQTTDPPVADVPLEPSISWGVVAAIAIGGLVVGGVGGAFSSARKEVLADEA